MDSRFSIYKSEKSEQSPRVLGNPVITPKSSFSYLPYSQSLTRNLNTSPDSSAYLLRTPREINQMRADEYSKFEPSLSKLIEKSKPFESFHLAFMNLKPICKLCTTSLNLTDRSNFSKLFRNIIENFGQALEENIKIKFSLKKTIRELELEREKSKEFNISNKALQSHINTISLRLNNEKSKVDTSTNNDQVTRKFVIEKEKLIEKIQMLEEYIAELKNVTKIEQISSKMENYKSLYEKLGKEYKMYSKEKETHIYKFQQEVGMLKNEIASNRDYLGNYQVREQEMENQLKKSKETADKLKNQLNESNERLALFREDMVRFFNYKDLHDAAVENMSIWKNKYLQLELNVISGNLTLNQEGVVWVDINDPIFSIFRKGACLNLINMQAQGPSMNRLDFASVSSKGRRKSNFDVAVDLSEIDLKELKLNRPSFAAFLEINDSRMPFECPFNNWIEATIRGIYDSKYYEHLLCSPDTGRLPNRFPEFTFTWLGTFTIDKVTRNVKELEIWKKPGADKIRLDFILGLSQDKFKKNWEVQTFIEFLNEDMTIDELGFYLHCRNLLFKGPQLSIAIGQFSSYHVLPLKRVEEVIDLVMEKINPLEREELKSLLTKKSKVKEGTYSIDSGLVMRLMLEYYIREKKSKYVAVRTLFNLVPKNGNSIHLDFNAFKEILTNLNPAVNEQTVSKLFRDSHSLGNGIITPDIIFIACNESAFFFHSLYLKCDKGPRESEMMFLYSLFNSHKTDLNLIRDVIKGLGNSEILFSFNRLEQVIMTKDNKGFTSIKYMFKYLWTLIRQVASAYTEVNAFNFMAFNSERMGNEDLASGPESCKGFVELLENLVIYKLSTKRAIRKIQRNWKGRNSHKLLEGSVTAFKKMIDRGKISPTLV